MAFSLFLFIIVFFRPLSFAVPISSHVSETYIIHVEEQQKPIYYRTHRGWYASILRSLPSYSLHRPEILYIYSSSILGFSARLTAEQSVALRRKNGVLGVVTDEIRHPHTTLTPEFLNLSLASGLWINSTAGDGVIVGVLDTGLWPEHRSFAADDGMSPVPSTWKGICEDSPDFPASSCNKKLIGARAYFKGYLSRLNATGRIFDNLKESLSPRDTKGHGTHTASTAAGSHALNAGLFDYARGEAWGMAPRAHVAAYKICWSLGCFDSDILAAMDQAIQDGVHVISLSVGSSNGPPQYDADSIAVGAFGAITNGVVVSCSAGNSGPGERTVTNIAPWIITVGASTVNREFSADVKLGNGKIFTGASLYAGNPLPEAYPLISGADAGSRYCIGEQLNPETLKGKIVVCDRGITGRVEKGNAVNSGGGVGIVLTNTAENGEELVADSHLIPAVMVGKIAGNAIKAYAKDDPAPSATIIIRGTTIGEIPAAPKLASFSSRGPNSHSEEILKPDVVAPGVNILAGWTGFSGPTGLETDKRRVEFNIVSGTSMSCPHVSGLAALLRKAHPEWSPAAIKSALITTAYTTDNTGGTIADLSTALESTPFGMGAGHVDPNKSTDPGLIYDMGTRDYVEFLCASGYTPERIAVFTRKAVRFDICDGVSGSVGDINYPTFSVVFAEGRKVVKYRRVATNVGSEDDAVYEAEVKAPEGVHVEVLPEKMVFSVQNRSVAYEVVFTSTAALDSSPKFGFIQWTDHLHLVRSPFAVQWRKTEFVASS